MSWPDFDRLTDRARAVIMHGRLLAIRDRCDAITPEHFLLALVSIARGPGRVTLERLGLDLSQHFGAITALAPAPRHETPAEQPEPNAEAMDVVEQAMRHAAELGHRHVGTEHLVLGLLSCENCPAGAFLRQHGITVDAFRETLLKLLTRTEPSLGNGRRTTDHGPRP